MVKLILNGCNGKMGKVVTSCLSDFKNIDLVAGIDKNDSKCSYPVFSSIEDCNITADVILDFSRKEALKSILKYSRSKKMALVLCTTGYSKEDIDLINEYSNYIPIFRSANMSIGINVINNILKNIAPFLYENFDIEIIEKHHNQKVDSPSGTALLLAHTIQESIKDSTELIHGREGNKKRDPKEIGMHSIRGGNIVGDHDVIFAGSGEVIEINHKAISRDVFAFGALRACEFISNKYKGLYNMDDMIDL
ncbi:4-hydroxy-tetrahydrodipicolinate reductase [Clostridium algidicarnis]|uniref:4-hydroxy-tetrahydrodipicolinate reductase n=2 Tax=Clostridium algidicarnis TaxID=37659 RepID=A0A2S6FXA9_9CLOT|nr:4-hydroxy-tetrahydrodipicolinate reductase [Clostridium algidicarnis]MBB6630226.1 4-hydroxy-tetrahydrodipicolinate reductase [Clostridium algidicarnis]MBB6698692.1 4-hydroxy-tetrahydrodipicolinate reductase [Clostridium algidicarnis]MBU3192955.1 4-hydroxy-tetrahydrodipicolinate reductase [Clostridium algidicarnis]MBU3203442.1 4-hydroxy-tetrahydrodipicolinate reductase [Clostridium algidicarnis]MBU3206234.1 4-hydroxy-tetrahydrodipicolinate reductase [Clostridium algidicarnis]